MTIERLSARRLRSLLIAVVAWTAGAPAMALGLDLAPSPAVACLTPGVEQRGAPDYPFAPWKRGEGGQVTVELVFARPDAPPAITVIDSQGDDALVQAVKDHLAAFRVPCLRADQLPLRLRQQYVFVFENRKVEWTRPVDAADERRRRMLACLSTSDGSKAPVYPDEARSARAQGNVFAQLRFTAPDEPPEATVRAPSLFTRGLVPTVEDWLRRVRLPCLEGGPLEAEYIFSFRLEGEPPSGFRDMDFLRFLRGVKDIDKQAVAFDTQTMACPFDVKLRYTQPFARNTVHEAGPSVAARRPLLDWLSGLVLDITSRQLDAVLGDVVAFTVPCIKIDIKPTDRSS